MNSIGSAAGYCTIHKMDKMFVGLEDATEPTCVRCVADARPKIGRTQTVEDPGENFNGFSGGKGKVTTLDTPHGGKVETSHVAEFLRVNTLEGVVADAVLSLKSLPMPEDLKKFKAVQKAIKTLENLVENTNG